MILKTLKFRQHNDCRRSRSNHLVTRVVARGLLSAGAAVLCGATWAAQPEGPADASAGEGVTGLWLTSGFLSHHTEQRRSKPYRESNPGLGLQWQFRPGWHLDIGHYRNSVNRPSNYLQVGWSPLDGSPLPDLRVSAGASVGVVNGYPNIEDGYFPTLVPVVSVQGKRGGMNLLYIPSVGRIHGCYAVQFKLRLR